MNLALFAYGTGLVFGEEGSILVKRRLGAVALCTTLALSMVCLGGCGSRGAAIKDEAVSEPAVAGEDQSASPGAPAQDESDPAADEPPSAPRFNVDGSIEPTALLDNDVLAIAAEGLEYRNDIAYLTLSLTNKTESELDVMTSTLGYSANYVNGCMMTEGCLSAQIPAGETAEEEVAYSLGELQLYGMRGIGKLGLGIRAVDEEFNEVFQGIVEVGTSLEGDSSVDSGTFAGSIDNVAFAQRLGYEVQPASRITQNLDGTGVDVLSAFLLTSKDGDRAAMVEFSNNTDDTLVVWVQDVAIDGALAYEGPWTTDTVAPGKRFIVDDLRLSSVVEDKAGEFDLSEVKEVGMKVSVTDDNGNTVLDSAEVTIAF